MAEVKRPAFYCIILRRLRLPLKIIIKPLRGLGFILGTMLKFVGRVVIRILRIFGKKGRILSPSVNAGMYTYDTIMGGLCNFLKCHTEAVYWWRKAAERGDEFAQFDLANAYNRGIGVDQNDEQAIYWWRKSAEFFPGAAIRLGMKYRSLGNYQQALECFHKVIERPTEVFTNEARVILSKYQLGVIYKELNDNQAAKKWLKEASVGTQNFETDFLEKLNEKSGQEVIRFCRNAAQEVLLDLTRLEEQEQAKQELEDVMAMFAHKFRGPLQSIEYLATDDRIRENVLMMNGMLNIFSTISTSADRLRQKLLQDRQGEGTLYTTLEQALALSLSGVLTLNNRDKIRQHYLNYAKITGRVPVSTTRQQWKSNYFDLEKQLQADWQNSFMVMSNPPNLDNIASWLKARFFPLEVHGFAEADIHFERYGVTESILLIIIPEIFLNALKYYASDTQQPVQLRWECEAQTCQFSCANPTSEKEQLSSKGSGRGHQFLSILAKKIGGHFPRPPFIDDYVVKFSIPTELLMEKHQ